VRSSDSPEVLSLERDLPTTAADVAALRRARAAPRIALEDYLRFLQSLDRPSTAALRARRVAGGPPLDLAR
jgi:hypothetical protein